MKKSFSLFLVVGLALFLAGCETIPDDPSPSLRLKVSLPEPADSSVAGVNPTGLLPPPAFDVYHLRISLSNPAEVFYVYFYEPGTDIRLMVTPGQARVVDVEAWMVPGGLGVPTTFNNRNLITVTPLAQRTVDLIGESVTVNILLDDNPNLGEISADPPHIVVVDGTSIPLPVSPSCPTPNYFYITVTDKKWGLPFPSVMAQLYDGMTPARLSIAGLPLGRDYDINLRHDEGGDLGTRAFSLDSSPLEVDLVMTEYIRSFITGSPEKPLVSLTPGEVVGVGLTIDAGLGSFGPFTVAGSSLGGYDTCGGVISGSTYTFTVPDFVSSCLIHVAVMDCAGLLTEFSQSVTIAASPASACNDGLDNDLDGLTDYTEDPGCLSADDTAETDPGLPCDDGLDNDGWGDVDLADPGCADAADASELDPAVECDDGLDNDGGGDADLADPGCADAADASELDPAVECDDGADNDGWGDADLADPGCVDALDPDDGYPFACRNMLVGPRIPELPVQKDLACAIDIGLGDPGFPGETFTPCFDL